MKRNFILILLIFLTIPTITFSSELIEIKTKNSSLILKIDETKELFTLYYGKIIDNSDAFLLKQDYRNKDHSTGWHAYSTRGGREVREPALAINHSSGELNTELKYVSHSSSTKSGVTTTSIILKDEKQPIEVELCYEAYFDEDVILTNAIIINRGKKSVVLENFYSSSMAVFANDYHLYHFNGTWAKEMQMKHSALTTGIKSIESKKLVRTTQTDNPSFVLTLNSEFEEESGETIIGALAWSGNYKLSFEIDEFNVLNILGGLNPYTSNWELASKESLITPKMIYTYSANGVGQASRNMHDWARTYGVWRGDKVRPTLLNSWEGAYFSFDTETITSMIDDAADMGLEMFVLDDGWFGNNYPRDNAKAGLGDWQVNTKKLPEGISHLADYANSKGIKFGIWIEPEMVNPESDLAKKHPDWIVGEKNREFPTMRNQLLLDLSNPKVQDFVFGVFDDLLSQSENISYIKWDANRHLENIGSSYLSAKKQQHLAIEYNRGLYSVYERIRAKYPEVIIQACASGGGRIDYGALKYHDEAWTSDNTDALSRAYIQYGTNMIYPALITGSHVSSSPNHQTKNNTTIKFRFDMAMSGRLGMELQPKKMTDEEKRFAKKAIASYKDVRDIITQGDLYRLSSPYNNDGYYAILYVSKDKKRALFFDYCLEFQGRKLVPSYKLPGVNSDLSYTVTELNVDKSRFWANGKELSGSFLINEGLNPNISKINESCVILLEAK